MGRIEDRRRRVEALRGAYADLPRAGRGEPGPLDDHTGERWDRANVLGHVAEMVPYWTAQARQVLQGSAEMGRDELGFVQRRQGIETLAEEGDERLLGRIDAALVELDNLLAGIEESDLERKVRFHPGDDAARELDLGTALDQLILGHAEAHLRQLEELG